MRGPVTLGARGTDANDGPTFIVQDGRYLSARWPGDAYRFARALMAMLDALPVSVPEGTASRLPPEETTVPVGQSVKSEP